MRPVNLDTLACIGRSPWDPAPGATDVDIWDKYDFPICGTYRVGNDLVVFTIIATAGPRSLWAYVPVPADAHRAVTEARFDTEAEFDAFLKGCFAGHEAVFTAAENFVITSKSDGILIPPTKNALLAAGARWYVDRASALAGLAVRPTIPSDADAGALLRAAQGVLADLPA
jgi:hypothetical protein